MLVKVLRQHCFSHKRQHFASTSKYFIVQKYADDYLSMHVCKIIKVNASICALEW